MICILTNMKAYESPGVEILKQTKRSSLFQDKFEGGDKEKIESAVQETLDWLDKNQLAEKDEFEADRS